MNISLKNIGKRFNREWIFRHIDYEFIQGKSYAITGANGSGKSTLLQVIAGATLHSEGDINYQQSISNTSYKQISVAAPYLDLIEEMTATEFLQFHNSFKTLTHTVFYILSSVGLQDAAHKQIRYFSSGMKQRLKLAQAFFSKTSILLLDEPTTNLDEDGIYIYQKLFAEFANKKLVIISSNDVAEYKNCDAILSISLYK